MAFFPCDDGVEIFLDWIKRKKYLVNNIHNLSRDHIITILFNVLETKFIQLILQPCPSLSIFYQLTENLTLFDMFYLKSSQLWFKM